MNKTFSQPFKGKATPKASLPAKLAEWIDMLPRSKTPVVHSGSRCGHDKHNPNFAMIESVAKQKAEKRERDAYGKKLRPLILRIAAESAKQIYFSPERNFHFAMHKTRNVVKCRGANLRQVKSQKREHFVRVLATILLHTDLTTMLLGYYDSNHQFHNYTWDYIASQSGVSYSICLRVIAMLKAKGVIFSEGNGKDKVCVKHDDGSIGGRASPKRVSTYIFDYFGLGSWLKEERLSASERLRKAKEEGREARTGMDKAVAGMMSEKFASDLSKLASDKKMSTDNIPARGDFRSLRDILG